MLCHREIFNRWKHTKHDVNNEVLAHCNQRHEAYNNELDHWLVFHDEAVCKAGAEEQGAIQRIARAENLEDIQGREYEDRPRIILLYVKLTEQELCHCFNECYGPEEGE